jgi:hypothetical protein
LHVFKDFEQEKNKKSYQNGGFIQDGGKNVFFNLTFSVSPEKNNAFWFINKKSIKNRKV